MNWGMQYNMGSSFYGGPNSNMTPMGNEPGNQFQLVAAAISYGQMNQPQFPQFQQMSNMQQQQGMPQPVMPQPVMPQQGMPQQGMPQPAMPSQFGSSGMNTMQFQQMPSSGPWPFVNDNTVQGVPGNEQLPPHDASKSFEFSEGSSTKENSSQLFSYEKRLKKKGKEVDANSNYSSQEGQYLTGAGWPRGRKFVKSKHKYVSHKSVDDRSNYVQQDSDDRMNIEGNLRRADVNYVFIQEMIASAKSNADLIRKLSCSLCDVHEIDVEEMINHIQKPEHLHEVYRWVSLPTSPAHQKYKTYLPPVRIKDRHLKYNFCEICLSVIGWKDYEITTHLVSRRHNTAIQKTKESIAWVKRAGAVRTDVLSKRDPYSLPAPRNPAAKRSAMQQSKLHKYSGDEEYDPNPPEERKEIWQSGYDRQRSKPSWEDKEHSVPTSQHYFTSSYVDIQSSHAKYSDGPVVRHDGGYMPRKSLTNFSENSTINEYGRPLNKNQNLYYDKQPASSHYDRGDMQRYVESRKSYQTREPFQLSENLSRAQQGSDGQNLALRNRSKLQEIVHSIRSTSTIGNELPPPHAYASNHSKESEKSKAAVLAMLRNPDYPAVHERRLHSKDRSPEIFPRKDEESQKAHFSDASHRTSKLALPEHGSEGHKPRDSAQSHEEKDPGAKRKRLIPRIIDNKSRDILTKRIESTWQKYYHKYYSCVATNPEIVLEMQKEYLRSYRDFFEEDPHFEFYYTKVAKPEDLREGLTLRIDRGSPGPDPDFGRVTKAEHLSSQFSSKSARSNSPVKRRLRSPRRISKSPPRNAAAHRYMSTHASRSPLRKSRSPQRLSRSPRRLSKSPQRQARSPRRLSRSPRRLSRSPRRLSRSPRRISRSPRRISGSPRRRSPGTRVHSRHRSRSPHRYSTELRKDPRMRKSRSPHKMQPTPLKDCRSFQESNKFHVMPESPQYQVDTKPKNYAPKSVDTEEKGSLVGKSPEESEPVLVDATDTDSTFISQAKDVPSNFSEGSTARDKGCTKFDIDEFKGTESCDVNEIARQLLDSANKINQAKAAVKESDDNLRMATSSDEQPLITSAEITSPTSISHGPHKSLKQKSLVLEVKDGRLSQLDSVYKLGGSANSSEKIDSLKNFGGIFPESSSNSPNSSVSTSKKLLAVENRFQDREEMEKGISVNTPLITSTTQMSRSTKRSSGSFGEASKSKSVLGRLGPQRKSNRGRNGKDDGQDFGRSEPNKDSESHRFGRSKSPRHRSRSSKSANMPSRRISRHASPGASVNKMFSDPFLAFVHETLTGIILIGQYRKALAKSTEPETLLSKIDQEQINMRNRMLTDNGHLIIQMARCCIENPQDLERAFPNVNKDIGPILRNLDRDVITLIADTPIVVNT